MRESQTNLADKVYRWWCSLSEQGGKGHGPNLRGDRAKLRRAKVPADVYTNPSFHALLQSVAGEDPRDTEQARAVAVLAAVLAHVDNNAPGGFGRLCAMGKQPVVSELRFRRILEKETAPELQAELTRTVRLLGRTADVKDLAFSVLFWTDETRRHWAFEYFKTAKPKTKA